MWMEIGKMLRIANEMRSGWVNNEIVVLKKHTPLYIHQFLAFHGFSLYGKKMKCTRKLHFKVYIINLPSNKNWTGFDIPNKRHY